VINSHFTLLILFSAMVSLVFTYIAKYGALERLKYFLYLFGSFVILSIMVGWLMYPFPF
jgi:hypothetical protein